MPATPGDVESLLRSVPIGDDVRTAAWRAYFGATDVEDFNRRFSAIAMPNESRQALFRLRFAEPGLLAPPGGPMPAKPAAGLPAIPGVPLPTGRQALKYGLEALPLATSVGATLLGGPGAGFLTSMALASLGAVPGVAAKGAAEEALGFVPRKTPGEAAGQIGWGMAEQAGGEVLGRTIIRPAVKVAGYVFGGPFRRAATLPENLAVAEANERLGLRLTPGQIAGKTPAGAVGRTLEFYGETSMFGRPGIEAAREHGRRAAVRAVEESLQAVAPATSAEAAGRGMQEAFETGSRVFHRYGGELYSEVDRLARGAAVNMTALKAEASRILQREMDMPAYYFPKLGKLTPTSAAILEDIANSPAEIPFEIAQRIRTKLLSVSAQPGELVAKEAPGLAKHFGGLMTGAMEDSASRLGPDALAAWQTARAFWRQGHDVFQRSLVQGLMERNPEALVKSIKPGAVSDVRAIRAAALGYTPFGTPAERQVAMQSWNNFREHFVRSALLRDPDAVGEGAMDLLNLKQRMSTMGRGVLEEMFGDQRGHQLLENLTVIGEGFSRVRKDMPFIRTYQFVELARAVNAVVTAGAATAAARQGGPEAALITAAVMEGLPAVIGKMMYSRTATRYFVGGLGAWLPEAMRIPVQAGTDALIQLSPRTSGLLARAFLTTLKEYNLSQEMRGPGAVAPKGPELAIIPGLKNRFR